MATKKDKPVLPGSEPAVEQVSLLEAGNDEKWREQWQGMPEFVQEDQEPFKTVYVHFETREDMEAFAKLVGQNITLKTRSIWYPEAEIGHFVGKRYVDLVPAQTSAASPEAPAPATENLILPPESINLESIDD